MLMEKAKQLLQIDSNEAMKNKLDELMLKNDHPSQQLSMGATHCGDIIKLFLEEMTFSVAWLGSKDTKKKTGEFHYVIVHSPYSGNEVTEAQWVGGSKAEFDLPYNGRSI